MKTPCYKCGSTDYFAWRTNEGGSIVCAVIISGCASKRREVAPELKQRFSDWVDQRTEKGVATYGEPLMTHNGRDAERDMTEELLDFCQYQQQHIMELKDQADYLERALLTINGPHWEMMA